LLLETRYRMIFRRLYVDGWRPVMLVYGLVGLPLALLFLLVYRNTPAEHPSCNEAEVDMIQLGKPLPVDGAKQKLTPLPMLALLLDRSMWLNCISQCATNIGWVFLVTWAPRYFQAVHHIPVETRALMTAIPALVGWAGMVGGGWLTDWMARRFGLRWGRALPLALTRFLAMFAYVYCLTNPSPWSVVVAFSVVAFATDLGTASTWAYMQDVGGQYVGSVLGWANMCGNLGAAVAPLFVAWVVDIDGAANWNFAFITCAAAFLLSGLCGLFVNATIPIVKEEPDEELPAERAGPEPGGSADGED
jgi:nitrate/nitrite transporter NarK